MTARRAALVATLAAAAGCAVAAAAQAGPSGLAAVVAGSLLVIGFFTAGTLPLLVAGGDIGRVLGAGYGLFLLLLTYLLRLAIVIAALALLDRWSGIDERWLGISVVVCALVWSGAQLAVVLRSPRTG